MIDVHAPLHPTATFSAARHELIGPDALLGPAELARRVCRRAPRRLGLLAITHTRMRRIDGWLADDALVTHPIAPSPDHAVIGTVCSQEHADDLVGAIIEALVGPVPGTAAEAGHTLDGVGALTPAALPATVDWLLLLSAITPAAPERWAMAATPSGLIAGPVRDPRQPLRLDPIGPLPNWSRVARVIGGPDGATTATSTPA